MKINVGGICLETPKVIVFLKSPWRANALEHKLFESVSTLKGLKAEEVQDELRITLKDEEKFQTVLENWTRILKGWQEDAVLGMEHRAWCWLFEGDTDADGYDHHGTPASLWMLVRVIIEHAEMNPDVPKLEHIDLESFGIEIKNLAATR